MRFAHNHDLARDLTHALRHQDDWIWPGLRDFLRDQGLDPSLCAVGQLFPEDVGEFGVAVTHDRSAFTFVVDPKNVVIEWDERADADSRFAYATNIFAAMKLLEEEGVVEGEPLDILVEYVAHLTAIFRTDLRISPSERWRASDYWKALHDFMTDRDIDPGSAASIEWSWTGDWVDGAIVAPAGTVFHFIGSLETIHGPIGAVTTWEAVAEGSARATYGELVDAGRELLRREAP